MALKSARPQSISKPLFFVFRFVQFGASLIVLAILGYFQYQLWRDEYPIPWEFSLLDVIAATTMISLFLSSILVCCNRLPALGLAITDGFFTLFWIIGSGMLLKAMGKTTTEKCTVAKWGDSTGIRVCHMFKTLAAFCVISVLLFVSSTVFAIVMKSKRSHGGVKYTPAHNPATLGQQQTSYRSSAVVPPPASSYSDAPKLGSSPQETGYMHSSPAPPYNDAPKYGSGPQETGYMNPPPPAGAGYY